MLRGLLVPAWTGVEEEEEEEEEGMEVVGVRGGKGGSDCWQRAARDKRELLICISWPLLQTPPPM